MLLVVSKEKSLNVRDVAAKDKEARRMRATGLLLRGVVWLIVVVGCVDGVTVVV